MENDISEYQEKKKNKNNKRDISLAPEIDFMEITLVHNNIKVYSCGEREKKLSLFLKKFFF